MPFDRLIERSLLCFDRLSADVDSLSAGIDWQLFNDVSFPFYGKCFRKVN